MKRWNLGLLAACLLLAAILPANTVAEEPDVMDLYGFVRLDAFYSSANLAKGDWMLFAPVGGTDAEEQQVFSMTARHSRFGFNFAAPELEEGFVVRGKLEADFSGGFPNSTTAARQPLLRLRHAWAQIERGNFSARFGQDWALIAGPFPNTASFVVGAGKGNLWMRYPQVRLTWTGDPVAIALSANRPMAGNTKYNDNEGGDFDMVFDGERTGMPWGMGRAWLGLGPATLSLSGHVGMESVEDGSGLRHDKTTWSMNGDVIAAAGPVQVTARAFYGENLNSFFGGVFQGVRIYPNEVANVLAYGGWAQAVVKLTDEWSVTLGGGLDDPDDEDLPDPVTDNEGNTTYARASNTWGFGNLAYSPVPSLRFVVEGEYLSTDYKGADAGSALRGVFMTVYTF